MNGLYRHPESKFYWFRFRIGNREFRRSTSETDEVRAIEVAREMLSNPPIEIVGLLEQEIEVFIKSRSPNYRRDSCYILKAFAHALGERSVGQIKPAHIKAWLDSLCVKPRTKESYRFQVQKLFDHFIQKGKARSNPARGLSIPHLEKRSTRKTWIHQRYWPALLDAATDLELRFCLYCGLYAGLRLEEVIMAKPTWIDRRIGQYGTLNVTFASDWHPKDHSERTIPLSPQFRYFLDHEFHRDASAPYMIAPHKAKNPGSRYRVEFRTRFENFVKSSAVQALQLPRFTFHDLRRSFASNLVSSGVSIYKVSRWLGDDVAVVQRSYGHLDPSDNDLARAFSSAHSTKKSPGPER